MERVAAQAGVGKKTVYRRWPSKAPLVAEAVLDAYGQTSSFDLRHSDDLRADLRAWMEEHAEFIDHPVNTGLIRALIAAAAGGADDDNALYRQLSMPQHRGLTARLTQAVHDGRLRPDADIDAIAEALIGTLLLRVLAHHEPRQVTTANFDGLLDALLDGVSVQP